MAGFVTNIKHHLLDRQAHIEVLSLRKGHFIESDPLLIEKVLKISNEILSVSPYQSGDVILQAGTAGAIARLEGIDPNLAEKTIGIQKFLSNHLSLNVLKKKIPAENIPNSALFPSVIISQDLMIQLGLNVGDSLTLVSLAGDESLGGFAPLQFPVVIAGFVESGNFAYHQKILLSSLSVANRFFQTENQWLGLQVKLKQPLFAEKIVQNLNQSLLPLNLYAKPWTANNQALLKALSLERWGMSFVMAMIILVGCFSISISLLLSIRRKSKEMAILRSLGLSQFDLSRLFLWQGFLIGFAGVVLGLTLGYICLYFISHFQIPFITSSYSNSPLPVLVGVWDLIFISVGSVLMAMLAAVWPAIEVRNLDVIEVLSMRN
jgi:lipoprotein-releasing system permease protein